jgi:hypothetical protein
MLLFGRVTYDLMASFWPTPFAAESMPLVAERMNHPPRFGEQYFSKVGGRPATHRICTIVMPNGAHSGCLQF